MYNILMAATFKRNLEQWTTSNVPFPLLGNTEELRQLIKQFNNDKLHELYVDLSHNWWIVNSRFVLSIHLALQ